MRCRLELVALLLAAVLAARGEAPAPEQGADKIIGTWRGSSRCVDRAALPACSDEQVVYEISAKGGQPDRVAVAADKIVDGRRVPMGVLEFTHDAKDDSWTTEIDRPGVHALWRLSVSGKTMTGSMILHPSKTVVRKMELTKNEGPADTESSKLFEG
jgi:hypothetical protein